jgi:hypothetical protein
MTKERVRHLLSVLRDAESLPLAIGRDWFHRESFNCSYLDTSTIPNTVHSGSGDTPERAKEECLVEIRNWASKLLIDHLLSE